MSDEFFKCLKTCFDTKTTRPRIALTPHLKRVLQASMTSNNVTTIASSDLRHIAALLGYAALKDFD